MAVKVAINGFGRIGRLAFRQMFGAEGYEVVAINDLTKPSMLADLLKYDTAQGGYCGKIGENLHTVSADDEANTITVDGKTLTIYKEADANNLPWGKIGVDVVLECTGFYCSKEKSMAHINAGAKKVVISAPAGNDLKTIVFSVNQDTLTADDEAGTITVKGKTIKIYKEPDANNCPWGELDVDVVLECSGFYTSKAKAQAHINAGAKKVVISAPAGNDLKTIVYNVNHETLTADDQIISAASCTTNCLAPMAKALNDCATIESGIMCTIHAYTGDQMILDGPQRKGDLRRSRAGACNIVPNSTGAAKAIGLVIPELNGKLIGAAQRVPTPTGSTTILNAVVAKKVTVDEVNAAMKAAATESFGYNEELIVSSDIVGMRFGSLFDATQTMVNELPNGGCQVQVVSWYDNENSYTSQMVRTIKYFAELSK